MEKTPIKKIDLLVGALLSLLFIVLSFQSFSVFESLGRVVYSVQMRLDTPRNPGANVVAIVNIDEKSIKQLGPWPWPRQLIAEMIPILKNNGAKLIALDLIFSDKERNLGLQEIRELQKAIQERLGTSPKDPALVKSLSDIESRLDSDRLLIKAVREGGDRLSSHARKLRQIRFGTGPPRGLLCEEERSQIKSAFRGNCACESTDGAFPRIG